MLVGMNDHDIGPAARHPRPWRRAALTVLGLGVAAVLVVTSLTHERFGPRRVPAPDGADRRPPRVGFAIVKTATLEVREGMLFSGGDFFARVQNHFSAFLVKHGDSTFLFDTGLGRHVREQYRRDMPLWRRPFFRYDEPVTPARDQLTAGGVGAIDRIFLSHSHWDHASGIEDFPGAKVWVSAAEQDVIRHAGSGAGSAWPSQVASPSIAWQTIAFDAGPYEGFAQSADLYGDGAAVVVPMSGHTAGSIGLFLRTDSGARFFFVGDVVWSAAALAEGRPRTLLARQAVDHDVDATQHTIDQIREAMRRDPALVVVPAHDGTVQRALGYFPDWVR